MHILCVFIGLIILDSLSYRRDVVNFIFLKKGIVVSSSKSDANDYESLSADQ
jgi:hypothetical protein